MDQKFFFKITIPNYNGMAYLGQCLDSVFSQTFQDFFVVLVDDGSTDFSYELAKAYERKYPDRMKVLRSPGGARAGACRNIGMDWPVECEYLYFMDSDDYLYSKDALARLYEAARGLEYDLVLFNWARDFGEGRVRSFEFPPFERCAETLAGRANNPNHGNCCYWCSAWSKIVKPSAAERFLEKGCMCGEDTWQWLKVMDRNPSWKQIRDVVYVYRDNPSGTINSRTLYDASKKTFYAELEKLLGEAKSENVKASIRNRLRWR